MANEGNVGVSASLNTKDVELSINKVVKAIESGTDKIAASVDIMVDKMEKGFSSIGKDSEAVAKRIRGIGKNTEDTNKELNESFTTVNKKIKELNEAFARGEGITTYKKKADELLASLTAVGYQADKAGKKISAPNTLTSPMSTALRKGSVSEEKLSTLNIPQLEQALLITKNRVALGAKDLAQQQKYIDLQDRINNILKEQTKSTRQQQEEQDKLNAKAAKKAVPKFDTAIGMSEKSITERIDKINALKKVQASLSKEDENYERKLKQVNKALFDLNEANKKAMSSGVNLENQQKKMGITMEALTRRMAYYFSVGAITNFAKNLVNIRGEFELQNKSLAAIIQNKDEADRLFARITALAVQSPFQLVELVSYTKQLAAYRIETEKLYDTTKMLADVSAGLGVDMSRLILAYGQVKSAAVLRGQELRQFTEAGIPIIDQLAKKFSELEGRAVSAGEVFEKVSNRMVSFKMVDEIFKDMTSSGGIFYNMQELQAETLKGKVSNLVDAYQVMLNKIGEGNEEALKGGVDAVRYLLDNYEKFVSVLYEVIAAFGLYKTYSLLAAKANTTYASSLLFGNKALTTKVGAELRHVAALKYSEAATLGLSRAQFIAAKATMATQVAIKTLSSAFMTFLPYAVVFGVIELSKYLYESATAASKLKKELEGFAVEGELKADKLSNGFKILADKARSAADGSEEQRLALKKLQTTYKDLLPAQSLTIEGLRKMEDGYKSVREAIYSKIKAQQEEAGVAFITSELEPKVKDIYGELKRNLVEVGNDADAAGEALLTFRSKVESGELNLTNIYKGTEAIDALAKIYNDLTGKGLSLDKDNVFSKGSTGLVNNYLSSILKVKTATNDLTKALDTSFVSYSRYTKGFQEAQVAAEKAGDDAAKKTAGQGVSKFEIDRAQLSAEREYLINWASETGKVAKEQLNKALTEGAPLNINDPAFLNVFDTIKKKVATADEKLSGMPKVLAEVVRNMNSLSEEVKLDFISQFEGKSFDEIISQLQDNLVSYDATIQLYSKTLETATKGTYAYNEAERLLNDTQLKRTNTIALLNAANQPLKKGKEPTKDLELEKVKKQLKLIEDLRSEYEKLTKAGYTAAEAQKLLNSQFGKQMTTLLPSLDIKQVASSTQAQAADIVKGLEKSIKSEAAKIEIDASVSKFTLSAAVDIKMDLNKAIEDDLSKIQQDYEIGIEIEGMGEMGSLFAQMFDYNPATLDQTVNKINTKLSDITKNVSGNIMKSMFEGNVDLLARPLIDTSKLVEKGWKEAGEGIATVFSSQYGIMDKKGKEIEILVTPILPDGTVLSQEELEQYIDENLEGASDILKADKKGIIIGLNVEGDAGEKLHNLQEIYYNLENISKIKLENITAKLGIKKDSALYKDLQSYYDFRDKIQKDDFKNTVDWQKRLLEQYSDYAYKQIEIDRKAKEEQEALDKLFAGKKESAEYKRLSGAISTKQAQDTSKLAFEKFKGTDEWIMAFEDLDRISTESLNSIIAKMETFKRTAAKNLSPTEMKELNNTIRKMYEAVEDRNPFALLSSSIKELKAATKEVDVSFTELVAANKEVADAQAELDFANQEVALGNITTESKYYKAVVEEVATATNKASNADIKYKKATNDVTASQKKLVKGISQSYAAMDEAMEAAEGLANVFDTDLGDAVSNVRKVMSTVVSATTNVIDTIATTAKEAGSGMSIAAIMASKSISTVEKASVILAVISAALQIATAIADLFVGNKNKKIDEAIEKSELKVKKLEYAYNDLSRAVDKYLSGESESAIRNFTASLQEQDDALTEQIKKYTALNSFTKGRYNKTLDELRAKQLKVRDALDKVTSGAELNEIALKKLQATNLEMQRQEIKNQIALEKSRSKKKQDKDKIADLENQYKELGYQIEDVISSIVSDLLGTDIKSAAEDFASTWIDAFMDGEDAMEAMGESFDDMIKNMIVKSLASAVVSKRLKKIFDAVEKASEDDVVTTDEIADIIKLKDATLADINKDMEAYKPLLEQLQAGSKENLSGIQKGISGITEEQASALESVFNSVLYQSYIQSSFLSNINIFSELNSVNTSQMLLLSQQSYQLLQQMVIWQESITFVGHKQGGAGLKVFMD